MQQLTAVWHRAASVVRSAVRPLVLYDLLFEALGLLVLTPLAALALERLVATSGSLSRSPTRISQASCCLPGGYCFCSSRAPSV